MSAEVVKELATLGLVKCDMDTTGLLWTAFVRPREVASAARRLLKADYYIEDITAVDVEEGFVVTYHFDRLMKPGRLAVRALIPHDSPKIPSIESVYQGASWHERETFDFYGIEFTGHSNLVPLLMPEDSDINPLVKTAKARKPAREVLAKGEFLFKDPGFTMMDEPEPEPEEAAEEAAE